MSKPIVGLIYTRTDADFAARLSADLKKAGYEVHDGVQTVPNAVAVLVQTAAAFKDEAVSQAIYTALDDQQHIVPVMRATVPLPKLIGNLESLDFTGEYPLDALKARLDYLVSPEAPAPMVVLTPSRIRRNRRAGLVVGVVVLFIFAVGIYGVGVLGISNPREEYEAIETQRVDQRNTIIAPTLEAFLPRSTEDAANFEATVNAMPTRLRPFLQSTATAIIGVTPAPEE